MVLLILSLQSCDYWSGNHNAVLVERSMRRLYEAMAGEVTGFLLFPLPIMEHCSFIIVPHSLVFVRWWNYGFHLIHFDREKHFILSAIDLFTHFSYGAYHLSSNQ